ncbi:hypothetical protein BGW42_002642 [Actinomortierella wolfii]|nr:hypothetical protein BGW42_002642 [Actinomortierella wolfii]
MDDDCMGTQEAGFTSNGASSARGGAMQGARAPPNMYPRSFLASLNPAIGVYTPHDDLLKKGIVLTTDAAMDYEDTHAKDGYRDETRVAANSKAKRASSAQKERGYTSSNTIHTMEDIVADYVTLQEKHHAERRALEELQQKISQGLGAQINDLVVEYQTLLERELRSVEARKKECKKRKEPTKADKVISDFRHKVWEVHHPHDPLPTAKKSQGDADDDDDLEVVGAEESLKCPLTTLYLVDPYTSTICKHSYSKEALIVHLRSSRTCPVQGCNRPLSMQDVQPNKVLARRVARHIEIEQEMNQTHDEHHHNIMPHPKRNNRRGNHKKKKKPHPTRPASATPSTASSTASSTHRNHQSWHTVPAGEGRHSFDSTLHSVRPASQKFTPPGAIPSLFFSLLNNDSNPSGSSTLSSHHAAPKTRSPPPSIAGASHVNNALSQHMSEINHNLSSSKDRFLHVARNHQFHHHHSEPSTPFAHPVSLSSGAMASLAALSASSHHGPYHTHHYHAPTPQKRVSHSRRSSLSIHPSGKASPANGYGEVPDQRQNTGFFNMAIFDPSPDHSRSARSSVDRQSSIRTASRPPSIESINSANSVPLAPPPPPPPPFYKRFLNHFSHRVIQRHIKFVVAFYITSLMALIPQVATALGPTPYLANVTVVFMHPSRTIGSMLEATVFSVIGALLAAVWILPCEAIVAEYNKKYMTPDGFTAAWAIEAAWFFVGVWAMTTAKSRYAKLNCAFIMFIMTGVFAFTKNTKAATFNPYNFLDLIGPMLLGVLASLIICVFLWPETASQGLGRAFNESLDTSRELLNLCTRSFLLNHKTIALPKSALEKAQAEVRQAQKKLYNAYRETRYEVTYSRADPADYKEVRVIVSAMMRHLGSMSLVVQNERLLFLGNSERDDDDLNTASGESTNERWFSDGSCGSEHDCTCSESDSSSDSDSDNDADHYRPDHGQEFKRRSHQDPEREENDYFGDIVIAVDNPDSADRDHQDTLDNTHPPKHHHLHPPHNHHYKHHHHHHHHHHRRANNGESSGVDTSSGVARSSSVGGSGIGDGKTYPKNPRGQRTRAAELRRIRQLLHRAENSTAALLSDRQENQRRLRQQQEEQLSQISQIFQQSGFASAPPTPGGRGFGIYKQNSTRRKTKEKGKGKKASLAVDGNNSSASSTKDESFFGPMGMTPIIRSAPTSPPSSRQSSIYEEANLDTVKSFKSLFSVRSSSSKFKPDRPASLRGFRIGKKNKNKQAEGNDDYDRSGYSSPVGRTSGTHFDFTRPTAMTLGGPYTDADHDRHQLAKAALAFHKKELERLKRERKRVSREEKVLRRKVMEEEKKKAEALETAGTDALPPKEVTFGDRKLFMSFLDIVREPLQRLSDSCSKVMVAMERELVAGLNVENDRLERIRHKNAQRAAALKAAEAKLASEMAATDGQNPPPAKGPMGVLRQPTMLLKGALSLNHKGDQNHESSRSKDGAHGDSNGGNKHVTAAQVDSAPSSKVDRWNAFRSLVGLRRRSFTATEEIEYVNALSRKNEGGIEGDDTLTRKERSDANAKEKDTANCTASASQRPILQHATHSTGLEPDTDEEFVLPADMTYVEFLSKELEIFDLAETEALRNLVSSHPALDIGPREEVFLIFFFLFALREIASELLRLGRYVEEMDAKWKEEKRKRRLWWPKVVGNFWQWFAWGSYTQIKTNEGYGSLTVNMTKNLEPRELPRTVEEEKAVVVAKAAKAAKEKAEQEKKRQEAEEAELKLPPLRRSVTLSTLVHGRRRPISDIEMGVDISSEKSPQTTMDNQPSSKEGGQGIRGTFFGFDFTKRHHNQEQQHRARNRRQSTGNYIGLKERSRKAAVSPRHPANRQDDEPLKIVVETPREGKDASNPDGQPKSLQKPTSPMAIKYAVGDIPSFAELQQRRSKAQEAQGKGVGELIPDQFRTTSTSHSSRVDSVHPLSTGSSESSNRVSLLPGASGSSSGSSLMLKDGQPPSHSRHSTYPSDARKETGDKVIRRELERQKRGFEKEIQYEGELSSDDSDDDIPRRSRIRQSFQRISDRDYRNKGSKILAPHTREPNAQQHHMQDQLAHHKPPRQIFVEVQKPKTTRYKIWESLQFFKSEDFRFGLKMAVALTFIGLWAWLNWSNKALATDRGQWAMLTVMFVLSPTVGATFSVCAMRVVGTLVGSLWALLTYLALPRNPYVICAMMLVIGNVFLMLESEHPKLGLIIVISYSSITFIMYEGITTDTIYEVCYQRAITVIVGIIISVIMNSLLWPIMARRELRKEIALLIGREGVLFAEIVNKFLLEDPVAAKPHSLYVRESQIHRARHIGDNSPGEHVDGGIHGYGSAANHPKDSMISASGVHPASTSSGGSSNSSQREPEPTVEEIDPDRLAFQHVEHQLQTKIIKILQLLELSESEPRLKGKFPMKLYQQIIQCCQNILDRLISMRMAAQLLSPEVRELVTGPMNYYRRDMVGALLLYFSVLSSSLASKSPLPPYLPSARMARLRVIYNVREAIAAHQAATGEDHYTYIYYYAFSSALEEVIEELELLAILIKPLVGVTAVTTTPGFNYQLSGDQLGLGPAVATTNYQLPPMDHPPVAPALGHGAASFNQHGQQVPSLLPASTNHTTVPHHSAHNQLLINPDILRLSRESEAAVPPPSSSIAMKHSSSDSLTKPVQHQPQSASTAHMAGPARRASHSRPDLKISTSFNVLKLDEQKCPSPTFAQTPMVEEKILGGTRQIQRLKEAIEAAQEASEHHVVKLPSPKSAPTRRMSVTVTPKNLPPSAVPHLTMTPGNESKASTSATTHHGRTDSAPSATGLVSHSIHPLHSSAPGLDNSGSSSKAPHQTTSASHPGDQQPPILPGRLNANTHVPPPMGIVTPFGSGFLPEAPLPLHLIPRRQSTVPDSEGTSENKEHLRQ